MTMDSFTNLSTQLVALVFAGFAMDGYDGDRYYMGCYRAGNQ
jgi:hypothetical protein